MARMFPALLTLALTTGALAADPAWIGREDLGPGEGVLTIVGTNDIHGGFLESRRDGRTLGGADWFGGFLGAIRSRARRDHGDRGAVLLLDAGDALQGTLLSNHSEGRAAVELMGALGYTAAIAGNHGFDFGPTGWRRDVVHPGEDGDPLGALRAAVAAAPFPFLGANVRDRSTGERLPWLPPHRLVPFMGRTVCVIGLENPLTARMTPPENVAGLEFGDGTSDLVSLVEELWAAGTADLFVAVFHEGDGRTPSLGEHLAALPRRSDGAPLVQAVIAGHSHTLNDAEVGGIPYVQSYSGGTHFGLVQLVCRVGEDGRLRVLLGRGTRTAGVPIVPRQARFLGEPVRRDPAVRAVLTRVTEEVAPLADRRLFEAAAPFTRRGGRTADSETGNLLATMMRRAAGTEVATINAGDVRAGLPDGLVTYADLFAVLPKNLRIVTMPELPVSLLVKNLERSVRTCGRRGALQFAGIEVVFDRDCSCPDALERADDRRARVLKVTTDAGRVLFERRGHRVHVDPDRVSVATTDFVMAGGAGYPGFPAAAAAPGPRPHLRDAIADELEAAGRLDPAAFAPGRYVPGGTPRCGGGP